MSGGLYSTEDKSFDRTLDLTKVKPYGDTMNDGKVQLSFTLPVPKGAEAEEAAKLLLKEMGFQNPMVVFSKELAEAVYIFQLLRKLYPLCRLQQYICTQGRVHHHVNGGD